MTDTERDALQQVFIRVCRDANWQFDAVDAACFAARLIKCSPLEIWAAFPSLYVMDQIAVGAHPSVKATAND